MSAIVPCLINKRWAEYKNEYLSLFRLGLPILVTQAGIIFVNFADTMMVASFSTEALAAAAFVNSLFIIVTVMMIGFSAGMIPLVGALFGRKETEAAARMFRAGLQVNSLVAIAFTLLMGALYFFLDRFGQPDEILPLARPYYLIILSSLLPISIFNTFLQSANSLNDTQSPMWVMLTSNLINVLGNYVLIFGHWGFEEMGLTGAGISTLTARVFSLVALPVLMGRKKMYHPYISGLRGRVRERGLRNKVWVISYPVMIQNGIECGLWTFGAIVAGWFGKIQLASYQVVNTMAQLGFMTFISFGVAVSVKVSNYMGSDNLSSVRRTTAAGLHLNLLLAALASAVFVIGGKKLIGVFTPDSEVVAAGILLIVPLVLYQFADATQLTYVNSLRGMGDVQPLLWVSVVSYICVGVPAIYWLAVGRNMGNVGIYYSFNIALAVAAGLLYIFYRRALGRAHGAGKD